jgi:hypothetical protein
VLSGKVIFGGNIIPHRGICLVRLSFYFLKCVQVFFMVGTPDGKKPHGRPRDRWEDNVNRNRKQRILLLLLLLSSSSSSS